MKDVNYERINYLIKQCMLNIETEEERAELNIFQGSPQYQDYIQKALVDAFYMEKPLTDLNNAKQEQIFTAIKGLERMNIVKLRWNRVLPWAAAAILLLCTMPLLFKNDKTESIVVNSDDAPVDWSSVDTARVGKPFVNDVEPAKEKASLVLSDGFIVDLSTLKRGGELIRAGLKIEKIDEGNLSIYFENQRDDRMVNRMNTITTPKGGLYWVTLGDGTKVQLNASSTLKFPTQFNGAQREVFLEGEGYFEVSKDKLKRFIVNSGIANKRQQVVVYGTIFNIMAYPEKPNTITTLLEGSVKVVADANAKESFLVPSQQATWGGSDLQIAKADLTANLAWKNKLFYFADEKLENVMLDISRWYDVDIKYNGNRPHINIWGQISREKRLSEVLDILAETNDIRFDIKGKEVIVRMK